jgi:hypothetical protein
MAARGDGQSQNPWLLFIQKRIPVFSPHRRLIVHFKIRIIPMVLLPAILGFSLQAHAQLSIDAANPQDWKISNGAISLDWNSTTGNVFSIHLAGHPDDLVDTTHIGANGQPNGLYMDNAGTNLGSGTTTASYHQGGTAYLDWWITTASSTTNAFTTSRHFLIRPNDPTLHVYFVADHAATDIAGSFGQVQYVVRLSPTLFNQTYAVNTGLGNQGVTTTTLPSPTVLGNTDPGRQVQNAVVDLHGLSLPAGFSRSFYTKYDYAAYEYRHQAHGVFGATYGAWTVIPRAETLVAGPTKQDLIFTENILMMECLSGHDAGDALQYTPPQGVATRRLFGPYEFHFNVFGTTNTTPATLYADATATVPSALTFYDGVGELHVNGYTASGRRGTVQPFISGFGTSTPNLAWTVLSDTAANFQYATGGHQYWLNQNALGNAAMTGVAPGTYRFSAYVLGKWGELRRDNVKVAAGGATKVSGLFFTPENFGTAAPVWTIGTPDRSAHEFLHGHDSNGDLRDFYGSFNYWQDFAATGGAQIYYATAVGSTAATNNPDAINYVLWGVFDPGLFGGIARPGDDTTDGYIYAIPSYVASLPGAKGVNGVETPVPPMSIHFTTTNAQRAQAKYAVLSLALAATEGSVTVSLNNHRLSWHALNANDAMLRSALAGYTQWIAYQWDVTDLNAAGADNILTISTSEGAGDMIDALRFETTSKSADPAVTGWHDYEYLYNSSYTRANDSVENN